MEISEKPDFWEGAKTWQAQKSYRTDLKKLNFKQIRSTHCANVLHILDLQEILPFMWAWQSPGAGVQAKVSSFGHWKFIFWTLSKQKIPENELIDPSLGQSRTHKSQIKSRIDLFSLPPEQNLWFFLNVEHKISSKLLKTWTFLGQKIFRGGSFATGFMKALLKRITRRILYSKVLAKSK